MNLFHYAFKVRNIPSTRKFYIDIIGCEEGRSTDTWIDFSFFGHQLSAHITDDMPEPNFCGMVDDVKVPLPHFGCLLSLDDFKDIQKRLEGAEIPFIIPPQIRYEGKTGEQHTMFVLDYSGNPIEFKSYTREEEIFN